MTGSPTGAPGTQAVEPAQGDDAAAAAAPLQRRFGRRPPQADHPLAWLIIACTLMGMMLAAADQTIVAAAMPKILSSLSGFNQYAWVTTAYLLGTTVTMPLYGKLADLFEAKWIFLFGLLLFVGASALCGQVDALAPWWHLQPIALLIAFRALQGIGAGALTPVGVVIMSSFVTPERRAGIQGTTGGLTLTATVAGPVIGGWLTDLGPDTWRWVFYINVPIGLFVAAALAIFLPRLRLRHGPVKLDYLGSVLLMLGAVPLLLAVSVPAHARGGISAAEQPPLLIAATVIFAVFVIYELRHAEPVLDPRLLNKRAFAVNGLAITLLSAITFACLVYIPLWAQGVRGRSGVLSGLVLAPLMLSSISGRLVANWLRNHHGRIRTLTLICMVLVVAGAVVLFTLDTRSAPGMAIVAMILLGAGLGAANMLLFAAALSPFGRTQFGQATGSLMFLRSLGGAIVTGTLGGVLSTRFAAAMATDLPHGARYVLTHFVPGLELDNPRLLLIRLRPLKHPAHPVIRAALAAARVAMHRALASSLHDVFTVVLGLAALGFVVVAAGPMRLTRRSEEEAAVVADTGVAAVGEMVLAESSAARTPPTQQACTVWDLMCHVLYWRHGAVQFASTGAPELRTFNRFEAEIELPTSLSDSALAAAFERAWPLVRARTALDRYRAESVVSLLWALRDVDGDIATCGGTGDGMALLLAMVVRDLGLAKQVYYFGGLHGEAPSRGGVERGPGGQVAALRALAARHGLADILLLRPNILPERPLDSVPEGGLCLAHIDYDRFALANACLDHLLPLAAPGAAIVVGHYHNTRDGARRATEQYLRPKGLTICAGPLPQAHFFTTAPAKDDYDDPEDLSETDWTALEANSAYQGFLRWVGAELAACYDPQNTSARDQQIVQALGRMALPRRADAFINAFIDTVYPAE